MALGEENPVYGPFFGVMGAAAAIIFSGKLRDLDSPLQILIYHMTRESCKFLIRYVRNYSSLEMNEMSFDQNVSLLTGY